MPKEGSPESREGGSRERGANFGESEVRKTAGSSAPYVPPSKYEYAGKLSPAPGKGRLGSEVEPRGLAGKEVPALEISADGSRIREFRFDGDKQSQYKAVICDRKRAVLKKKDAELDKPIRNPLASDYVQHHSEAAKEPDSRRPPLKKVYGDVIVVGYSWGSGELTGLDKNQLTDLTDRLQRIRPGISIERIKQP
jgi:hypothetical protein